MKYATALISALSILTLATQAGADELSLVEEQKPMAKNALYVELGGNGAGYTLNYERRVHDLAAIRVGAMFWQVSASVSSGSAEASASSSMIMVPVMASFLGLGSANHKLEISGGAALTRFSGNVSTGFGDVSGTGMTAFATGAVGYRYAPRDGGFVFRAAYTPIASKDFIFHWGGVSFGYSF